MKQFTLAILCALALVGAITSGTRVVTAAQADPRLGAALHAEEVERNDPKAVELYKAIVADVKSSRDTVARALLQLGGCYERLKNPEARPTYERIIRSFAEFGAIAAPARQRLQAIQAASNGPSEHLVSTDRYLNGVGALELSPDGRWALGFQISGTEFDGTGLIMRNLETGAGRQVFYRKPGFAGGEWIFSPDSRKFAALMPEMIPQSEIARSLRGEIALSSLVAPGVFVVGTVAAGQPPVVIEIPKMQATSPFDPFASPIAWARDGSAVAFSKPGAEVGSFDIHLFNATTGEARSLGYTAEGSPSLHWSPSGQELLVHVATQKGTTDLRVITVATGRARSLPVPGAPGARLRIMRWNNSGELSLRHLDPASPSVEDTYLVSAGSGVSRRTCSGQSFNLAGAGGVPNATADICREITHDGTRQIVWRHATRQLVIRDLRSGQDRPLTTSSGEEYFGMLSPDDKREVFISNRNGRWGLYAVEIANAPVAKPLRLSSFDDMPAFSFRGWTPDGFIANVIRNDSSIMRVNVDPATAQFQSHERLTQDGSQDHTPSISPDGKRITYWSRRGSRFGVAVMDSNGADERLLHEVPQYVPGLQPSWRSPVEILFTVGPKASSGVFVPAAPGEPLLVHSLNALTGIASPFGELRDMAVTSGHPQLLPAVGEIFFLDESRQVLKAQSLVTGARRTVATLTTDGLISTFLPTPDGRRVAYSVAQRYENGFACMSKAPTPVERVDQIVRPCEIMLLDLASGERKQIQTTAGQNANIPALIAWSPDARFLLYGGGRPQILEVAMGKRWPLLSPGIPLNWDRTASWSPDGTFIVLTNRAEMFEWRRWSGIK